MGFDNNYCYSKNDQIIYKDLEDGPVLIDPYRRALIKLNPTALRIWQLSDGKHSAAAIVEMLKDEFEIDAESLEKDVIDFLKDLSRREIIR
jgi:coenzyme PQQ biosynthesis protein PqqD